MSPSLSPSPTAISPYEQRWPGYWLPWWARKQRDDNWTPPTNGTTSSREEEDVNPTRPEAVSICFVHVGKTAGSTVGCALGFNLHCHGDIWRPDHSLLHRYTTHVHHSDINDCSVRHDYYLVTVRDPVERLLSWYEYERRKLAELRKDCNFRTLNDLAVHGLGESNPWVSRACRDRARRAVVGEEQFGYHAYHNYGYHMRQVPSNATVVAIRSEHLVEDWNSIEAYLGSSARVESFPLRNRAGNSTRWRRILTDEARSHLCRHLCDEIQVYKTVLHRAVNLNWTDVDESMAELRRSCPREADLAGCPQ
jgi:Sulfotransferase family